MRAIVTALVWMAGICVAARAQDVAAPGKAGKQDAAQARPLPVLHVYADLLQIPVLVLSHDQERLGRAAPAADFAISVARGPWFPASHVRQEGEDPITLSILLDRSGWTGEMIPKVDAAVAALGMGPLHAQDRVSVYMLDCRLATAEGQMVPDATKLMAVVDELGVSGGERQAEMGRGCGRNPHHLWDALAALIGGLSGRPGRRVILALTDGEDEGSRSIWRDVASLAQERSVTLFGVTYLPPVALGPAGGSRPGAWMSPEAPFSQLCQLTGGVDRLIHEPKPAEAMSWVVQALRERYIVEFPRPANSQPGRYELTVRVTGGPDDFIRPAGLTFPGPSKAELDDPTTIKDETTQRPTVGKRKILPASH